MKNRFYYVLIAFLFCAFKAVAQHVPCLTDSCCRQTLFSHYNKPPQNSVNVFADPVAGISIKRQNGGIEIDYVEHTIKGIIPGSGSPSRATTSNYYYSLNKKMLLSPEGTIKEITGKDTIYHLYTCRFAMGADSSVSIMGTERLHNYRPGDILLYDQPGGKVLEKIRETGFKLKGSIECSVYSTKSDAETEVTEYKLVVYKGKHFWAKSNWMKTVFTRNSIQKAQQEQYMISWMIED